MSKSKPDWAMPLMRLGYAGRGLTYVAIAGISLWTIWRGGQAQGTSEALKTIETSPFGMVVLFAIGLGLICYMIWRVLDGVHDLEAEGEDATGWIGRAGMIVTGLLHGIIGLGAMLIAVGADDGGGGDSTIVTVTETVMSAPFGILLVGMAGAVTVAAGVYYLHKAYTQSYLQKLRDNHATRNWQPALRIGVAAQGVVVTIVGGFLILAAWRANPENAGGLEKTFNWLSGQVYGQVLVTALCVGLLAFAMFLFVNAVYRVVPGLKEGHIPRLADRLR